MSRLTSPQLVAFIEIPEGNFYRGGKPAATLIRITLQNMMGSFNTIQKDNEFLPAVKAVWKPWVSVTRSSSNHVVLIVYNRLTIRG